MIKFYDSSGTVHFGQATITRKTSVNGGLSLTGEVFAGNDVLNGLDYGWRLNFDNEKYVITYKKLSDDTNTVVFDAVQQFFWDFAKVALHTQYTGSHKYSFYLGQLFDKSGYTYKNDATVPAFEKENWGYKNKLDLFNDIMDQANVEFEVHNETVHIAKQLGSDLTNFVRKGINLSDLTEEMKISDFATYARGYGAFKDDQDKSKGRLEVEYRSKLAKKFGDLEMDPIVDERYTVADNLIAELKKQVDATYTVSMTMNIYDLENAGYPNYEAPKVGDWILAIDEALNFKRKIRIIQLKEQFDVTGKRIGYTATCGDLNIVDQYTKIQSSLDSKVQRIQKSVDAAASSANGKNTNYYGAKEPVSANEGDLWFDQSNDDPDKWSIKQWLNGRWEQITLNPGEVDAKVDVAKNEARTATENAKSTSDKADQLAAKYDDTNALANQAIDKAVGAQSNANSAIAKAESTASEFGKVSQKTESALTNAKDAQTNANTALDNAKTALDNAKTAQDSADNIKVDVDDVKGTLDSKADKTDVDAVTKQVSTAETNITQNANSIKSKAGQSDVDALTGRVSSAESEITQNAKDITSKVSSSDVQGMLDDGGYATQLWTGSQIKQSADEINSTVTSVSNKVDNLQIGGRNYLLDSDFYLTSPNVSNFNINLSTSIQELAGKTVTLSLDVDVKNVKTVKDGNKYTRALFELKLARTDGGYDYIGVDWKDFVVGDSYSGRITKTTTIPNNDYVDTTRIIEGVYTQGFTADSIKVGHAKLEFGTKATDWSPAPEDMATVTAVSKLSQTVDGMKLDISKKVEQKDLNGYATQTWAQNKINATADGINGTMSSIKNTVDGQTTDINDLKADSSSFKNQFTTVNDTLDKHSMDIGTLQATSKSLSSNFDSLSSDNQTNKHNISQLQASATAFNSTLETVQTQVQNSAVGTNLLLKTGTQFNMTGNNTVNQVKRMYGLSRRLEKGTKVTLSFDAVSTASAKFHIQNDGIDGGAWTGFVNAAVADTTKKHYVATATLDDYADLGVTMRLDNVHSTATITVSNMKLELGSHATDYLANPADNATVDAVSSISQTVDHIQTTVRGKVDNNTYQSEMTQLDNQMTSVVGQVNNIGQRNLVYNSELRTNTDGWESNVPLRVSDNHWDHANGSNSLVFSPSGHDVGHWSYAYSKMIPAVQGMKYSASATLFITGNTPPTATAIHLEIDFFDDSGERVGINAASFDTSKWGEHQLLKVEGCATPTNATQVCLAIQMNGDGNVIVNHPMLVADSTVGAYLPDTVGQSEFSQLENNINLKVSKNGVVNAVNISPESIQIYGNKLHITADTYIDNAVIKDAMIANLDASKITAGTLNAANVNIINLNANNITTGTLRGTNLSMNLNTGEVLFQKGSIKSTNGNLNIDIDSGKMGVVNSSGNGFRFEDGKLYLASHSWIDALQSKPDYGYITYQPDFLSNIKGMKIAGTDGIAVTAGDYDVFSFIFQHQPKSGAALSLHKNKAFLNARDRTRIEGGSMYTEVSDFDKQARPAIVVGGANGSHSPTDKYGNYYLQEPVDVGADIFAKGNKITLQGGHNNSTSGNPKIHQHADLNLTNDGKSGRISSAAIFNRTYSNSPNVYITGYGTLGRSTSASKYKLDISDVNNLTEKAQVFLAVKPKQWFDKQETQDFADTLTGNDRIQESPTVNPHAGFIAEDLAAAGLNEFISYGADGSLQGIQYDRLPVLHHELLRQAYNKIDYLMTQLNIMDKKISKLEGEN